MSKRKKSYRILVTNWPMDSGPVRALEVMAEPVEIYGWSELNLIIHRHPNNPGFWHVTDSETGTLIEYGYPNKKDAIEEAADRLNGVTIEKFRKLQKKAKKKFGDLDKLPLADLTKGVLI